jgi:hypothetical protein
MKKLRFQFSVRRFMLVTVVIACALVPVAWVARERRAEMRAREAILEARELALRSVVREGQRNRIEPADVERLQLENADLKKTVEELRRQVDQLRGSKTPGDGAPQ